MHKSCTTFILLAVTCLLCAQGDVQWKSIGHSKAGWWKSKATYPVWSKPSGAQSLASELFKSESLGRLNRFLNETRETLNDLGKPHAEYFAEIKTTLSVNSPQIVSGYLTHFEYTGGAHPNTFHYPINVGIVNGKPSRLTLKSLLAPGVSANQVLNEVVLPKLNAVKEKRELEPADSIEAKLADSFIITPQGLSWIFQPYAVGAYVEGTYIIKASYAELGHLLRTDGVLKGMMTNSAAREMLILQGEVFFLERIALPPNARLMMRVVDVSRADAPSRIIFEKTIPAKSGATPFEMQVPKGRLREGQVYHFQARILVDNSLWFINDIAIPVPLEGWDEPKKIRVIRASSR